jgi:hypothetical protein
VAQESDPDRRRGEHGVDLFVFDETAALLRVGLQEHEVRRPHEQVRHYADVHLGRVVERERMQHPVLVTKLECLYAANVLGHKRPMRQHGAFGCGSRSRRVQYLRHVLIVYLDLGLGGTFPASRHAHNVEFISIVERAADLRLSLVPNLFDVRLEPRIVKERL